MGSDAGEEEDRGVREPVYSPASEVEDEQARREFEMRGEITF